MAAEADGRGQAVIAVAAVGAVGVLAVVNAGGDEHAGGLVLSATIATGTVVWRVVHSRLGGGWVLFAAGSGTYAAASIALYVVPEWPVVDIPFPSAVDGLYVSSYLLDAGFLVWLIRTRGGGDVDDQRLALIDAAIFTLTLMVVLWTLLIESNRAFDALSLPQQASIVALAAVIALLFALAVRLVIGGAHIRVLSGLLLLWVGLELASAASWAFARASEDFHHAGFHQGRVPPGILRMGSCAALAALALHPRLSTLARPPDGPPRATSLRLRALLAASLIPLAAAAIEAAEVAPEAAWLTLVSATVFVLIIVRLSLVTVDLDEQRQVADQLRQVTEELRYQSLHDALTGTGNRSLLTARLEHALRRRSPAGKTNALLLLDLDGFKTVNDTLGHRAGDHVLHHVATKLMDNLRTSDTVARIGGDEFGVLLEDVTPNEALRATRRLVDGLRDAVEIDGRAVRTRASIGVYFADADAHPDIAMRNADLALYAAKDHGGERYEVFEPALHEAFLARHQLELELRDASSLGQLRLLYQPVINLTNGRVDGVEALVRWQHPERGLVPPCDFMTIAEESGIIIEIGRWVLSEACRQLQEWRSAAALPDGFQMAVNLSRRQLLDRMIVADVEAILADAGVRPADVVLEVTETALMSDTEQLTRRLEELSAVGVAIAMDDFGTGYSSLDQLRRLPIDVLKIDRAFVKGIDRGPEDFALATAIIKLAASLGKATVAEGVETPAQLAHLRSLRAGRAQGYLFAPPLDPGAILPFIAGAGGGGQATTA